MKPTSITALQIFFFMFGLATLRPKRMRNRRRSCILCLLQSGGEIAVECQICGAEVNAQPVRVPNASTRYLYPSVLFRGKFALMTRLARMVVSGLPHHVTQRGNRRESIFFKDGDQEIYRDLLGEQLRKAEVEVWAYCLMPNHVHLILNPRQADGLGRAVGESTAELPGRQT